MYVASNYYGLKKIQIMYFNLEIIRRIRIFFGFFLDSEMNYANNSKTRLFD